VDEPDHSYVPTAPNEGLLRGKLLSVRKAPGGVGHVWQVDVEESENVGDLPNFVRPNVGSPITIYVHPGLKARLRKGERIEARVSFQGDERCGAFFLHGDDVRTLSY
jgi:hypothetical protein